MSISLDNINFCYQPPPKPTTTSRWKPYQVPPTLTRPSPSPRTCLVPSKLGVSAASVPTRSGTSEAAQQTPGISSGGSTTAVRNEFDMEIEDISLAGHSTTVSEKGPKAHYTSGFQDGNAKAVSSSLNSLPAVASASGPVTNQTSDSSGGGGRDTVQYGPAVEDDVLQERLSQQAFPSLETANSSDFELVGSEREFPGSPMITTLDLSEASGTFRQSGARSTPSTSDNLCAHISQSPSTGPSDSTLNTGREFQPQDLHLERTSVRGVGVQGGRVSSHGDEHAGDKASCVESLRHGNIGAENPRLDTSQTDDGHPDGHHGNGAASSPERARLNWPSKTPAGQAWSLYCHPQPNIGREKQVPSENNPIRELADQVTTTTENLVSPTLYGCQISTDNCERENDQGAGGPVNGCLTLTSRLNCEQDKRLATTRRYPSGVGTTAESTSVLADDATREHLGPPRRQPDCSLPPSGEAQEVFGRGILRIQPHGPRNAYIITFLQDIAQPASTPSTSEKPCEKPLSSSGRRPENPANAQVEGHDEIPIDPLILADGRPCETEDLRQPFPLDDNPNPSETTYPYPDPPSISYYAPGQRDSVAQERDEDPRSAGCHHTVVHRQLPHPRHSIAASMSPSNNTPDQPHISKQSKSCKRKRQQSDGQPPKRARGSPAVTAEENPFTALRSHFLSLPLDERLQLLPWLFEGALPRHMPDLPTTGKGHVRSARCSTQSPSEARGNSRKGMPWSSEEMSLLLRLRRDQKKPWSEVKKLFSDHFPGRSQGSIQVFWSTTLKNRMNRK